LAGKAGVGKSALAIHVAHRLRGRYPDAQLYVNLRGAEPGRLDAAAVLADFLGALGLAGDEIPQGLDHRAAVYRAQLAGRRALVVLDNAHDETQVRPLLPGSPSCAVIVTSRAPLGGLDGVRLATLDVFDRERRSNCWASSRDPNELAASHSRQPESWSCAGALRWPFGSPAACSPSGRRGRWPSWPIA
jgi:predicted ATPase